MEKYTKPEIKVESFKTVDVIKTSSYSPGEPTTKKNSTPYIPIP